MPALKKKYVIVSTVFVAFAVFIFTSIPDPQIRWTSIIVLIGLTLWLTELVPFPATTLLLCALIPLFLAPFDRQFRLSEVLLWAANPVLPLFFGGFVMGVAMCKHMLDRHIATWMVGFSRGRFVGLMLTTMFGTAFLSMWMSNIAAAAMMIASLRPLWREESSAASIRAPLLLSVAFGANFGGMATPIGTGPNAIAIAAVQSSRPITFVEWMSFGVPLTLGMLVLAFLLIRFLHPIALSPLTVRSENIPLTSSAKAVAVLFVVAACLWLLEPLHKIPAPVIAVLLSGVLFATGLLKTSDLAAVDWQTLFLIAGGLILGELVDRSGITQQMTESVLWSSVPRTLMIFTLIFATAFLSAIASNTAAAALFIPFVMGIDSSLSMPILIALGASMGAPFVISTPPNAMAYGEGGLRTRDLLIPGLILMIFGCAILILTGEKVLSIIGIR